MSIEPYLIDEPNKRTQVMLDIETLGTKPGSVILSIGAVKFDNEKIVDEFEQNIDVKSCIKNGLTMDAETVIWWMQQNDEARCQISRVGLPLPTVLNWFAGWLNDSYALVWGNGANFDNVMLAAAYDACEIERPWGYYNDRCYRTVKAMFPEVPFEQVGAKHNALDDAKSQALHLIKIMELTRVNRLLG